jgi:hypothetical protein
MAVRGGDTGAALGPQIAQVELDVLEAHVVRPLELGLVRELQEGAQIEPVPGDGGR